jgi:hypothetical protein
MFGENGSLPITGGVLLAAALYAGISLFVTGPLVGERMVAKLDWGAQCARQIRAEVEAIEPPILSTPKLGCNEMFGFMFGAEGAQFCNRHGNMFSDNPVNRMMEGADNAQREAQQRRMDYAASRAGSRCECAVTTTLETRRTSFALLAGSARLITPPSIRLLESDLVSSLNTPACAMRG